MPQLSLHFYIITFQIPFFVEIKKFRLKKNRTDNIIKQTVSINKNLLYNLKVKQILSETVYTFYNLKNEVPANVSSFLAQQKRKAKPLLLFSWSQ